MTTEVSNNNTEPKLLNDNMSPGDMIREMEKLPATETDMMLDMMVNRDKQVPNPTYFQKEQKY